MRIDKTDPVNPKLVADVVLEVQLAETREKIAGARAQAQQLRAQAATAEAWADAAQAELNAGAAVIAEYEALKPEEASRALTLTPATESGVIEPIAEPVDDPTPDERTR